MIYLKTLKQRKIEREKEKQTLKSLADEEDKIKQEIDEIMPESKFTIKESINLLKGEDEEEQEYYSYLTEDEKKEELDKKKEQKKILKVAISVLVVTVIMVTIGSKVFYDTFKNDLLKITEPLLKEHYQKKTGNKAKTKTIEEFKTKDKDNNEVGSGIYLLTTKDNKHIMSVNNVLIGDDINNSDISESIKSELKKGFTAAELVTDSIKLSYDDYYLEYNRFLDYINVLPSGFSKEDLLNSNKLVITYKAIYKGQIDTTPLENIMSGLSSNSTFILLRQDASGISNIIIIKKEKTISMDVTALIEKEKGITYLELDRKINSVSNVEVKLLANSSVSTESNYNIINPIVIKKEEERGNREEPQKENYFFLRFDSGLLNKNSFVELNTSKKEDTYTEKKKEDYDDIYLISIGSSTYLLGENNLFVGKVSGKKSFLCNLGIC